MLELAKQGTCYREVGTKTGYMRKPVGIAGIACLPVGLSVCLSTCISLAPNGWIFIKLDTGDFYGNLLRKSKLGQNHTKIFGTYKKTQMHFIVGSDMKLHRNIVDSNI